MHPDPAPSVAPNDASPAFDEDAWFTAPSRRSLHRDYPPREPWQFSILHLMIYTAVIAAALGILRALGIIGLAILVAASAVLTVARSLRKSHGSRETFYLLLWGIAMPLGCVLCDPIFFHESPINEMEHGGIFYGLLGVLMDGQLPRVTPLGRWAYPLILTQFAVLALWLAFRRRLNHSATFLSGMLSVGAAFAGVAGLLLLIPATMFLIAFGLGIVGYVPLAAAWVYLDQAVAAWRQANRLDDWPREEHPDIPIYSIKPARLVLLHGALYHMGIAAALVPPVLFVVYGPR